MANVRIAVKLVIGFAMIVLIVAVTSGSMYFAVSRTEADSANNNAGSDILNSVDNATEAALAGIVDVRSYVIDRDAGVVASYKKDIASFGEASASMRSRAAVYSKTAEVAAFVDKIDAAFKLWQQDIGDVVIGMGSNEAAAGKGAALIKSDHAAEVRRELLQRLSDLKDKLTVWSDGDQAAEDGSINFLKTVQMIGLVSALVLSGLIAWLLARAIATPVVLMASTMNSLAAGKLDIEVPALGRKDEVGQMAAAVQTFKVGAIEKIKLEQDAAASQKAADADRARNDLARAEAAKLQAHVVASIGTGLERLSSGNLLFRIETPFTAEYEKLRVDFNGALAKLQETMTVVSASTAAIRSGSTEISTASDDLARRTEQQAASLEETAAALDEVTATVKRTSEGSNHARSVVAATKADAEHSSEVVGQAVVAMSAIETSAQQVSQIIGVIDEIAFQTSLLALNAGVEAARAGDAGRGFAVVASEVRALAQRSAEAAKEIKALISTSSQQVSAGVDLVNETGQALKRIATQVSEVNAVVSGIANSTQEQATALQQVNTAVNQMDQVTQQNAAMVEQSTAASHGLAKEAQELARLMSGFTLGDPGAASQGRSQPARTHKASTAASGRTAYRPEAA